MKSSKGINIGNLLDVWTNKPTARVHHSVQKVENIDEDKINGISIEYFEPIPLTSDWITKFDAIVQVDSNIQIGKLYFKRALLNPTEALLCCDENYKYTGKNIGYVHELQNFYKINTGEELEIHL